MNVGTRSLLFGAHQFLIHPLFVALAWWKLYGFPVDPRLWVAFFLHDIGYWGKLNMDGPEGENHPLLGAKIMGFFFGHRWYKFCLYHSRFKARMDNEPYSKLCVADKLSLVLVPLWFYLPRVILSGEIREYLLLTGIQANSKYDSEPKDNYFDIQIDLGTRSGWFKAVGRQNKLWVIRHIEQNSMTIMKSSTILIYSKLFL